MIVANQSLRRVTWNLRGLNDKVKRSLVLQYFKTHDLDIVCLQETYLVEQMLKWLLIHRMVGVTISLSGREGGSTTKITVLDK